jgi:hypothetical protein
MHEALCRSSGTTLDILHVERQAADHSANIGSNKMGQKVITTMRDLLIRRLAHKVVNVLSI